MKYILLLVCSLLLCWLLGSFTMWELNPGNWSFTQRVAVGVGWFVFTVGVMSCETFHQ